MQMSLKMIRKNGVASRRRGDAAAENHKMLNFGMENAECRERENIPDVTDDEWMDGCIDG